MRSWIVVSLILLVVAAALAIPLSFVNLFGHEGGHGLLVVPAILLNREVPVIGGEGENPFRNFPPAALFFMLSFPLGVMADALVAWLAYRNARRYRQPASLRGMFLLALCLGLATMTAKSALSNLLTGQDFSFLWRALHLPFPGNDALGWAIKAVAYLGLPLYLGLHKGFALPQALFVGIGAYGGGYLAGTWFLPGLAPWLMGHFFWLFIIGLPVLLVEVAALLAHPLPCREVEAG